MPQVLSLTVPDSLGERLKHIAAISRRPIEDVIVSALDAMAPTSLLGRLFGRRSGETLLERQLKLEIQHAERLRALEMGLHFPEVERQRLATQQQMSANRTAILLFFLIAMLGAPAAMCGIATGATGVVMQQEDPSIQQQYVAIVWSAAGFVIAATEAALVAFGVAVVRSFLMASPPPPDTPSHVKP
jgi:predicted transcriptional regulator